MSFVRGLGKYARLWIVPLGLVLVAFGAQKLARSCFDSLVHFRAPQFTVKPGGTAEPVSRVVLVVIDALRIDAFNNMRYLSSLKESGATFILKTGQLSITVPAAAVIATGAWPDVTGATTNWFEGSVRHDNLFSLAKDSGLTTVLAGGTGLFAGAATKTFVRKWKDAYITFDEETLTKTLEFLSEEPEFSYVHFTDTDEAGHEFGGASPEYQKYADHIDGLIERLHKSLREDTVLMVTSDHGQIDRGGHGGWEAVVTHVPLLLCGSMVKPGSYGMAEQTDIAPTVAALLGLPVPPYSQGRILADALNLGEQEGRLLELQVEHKEVFTRAYLEAIGADFERVRGETAPAPQEDAGAYWDRVLARGKAEKTAGARVRRIPLFLIVLVVPFLAFWYFKKRFRLSVGLPLGLSLLYFAVFYGIFFASGKTISFSSINYQDWLRKFLNETMLYAALSAIIVAIGLAFLARRRTRYETAQASVILAAFIAFLIIVQVDIFLLYNGPLLTRYIPNMFLAFKYYLDLASLVAIGVVSVILPLISMGTHRVIAGSSTRR